MSVQDISTRGLNHQAARAELLQSVGKLHDPPPGTAPFTPYEKDLWEFLTKSRAYDEWSTAELYLAARVVKLASLIKQGDDTLQKMLDAGQDFFDPDSYANTYNKELMRVKKEQLSMLRSLGFTRTQVRSEKNERQERVKLLSDTHSALEDFGVSASFLAR